MTRTALLRALACVAAAACWRSYPCSQSHTHPGSQLTVVARTRDLHQGKSVPASR